MSDHFVLSIVICFVIGYALGNINPSYLIVRRKGYDVRKDGSGNAGASNAFILAGKTAFLMVAVFDILKAYAACRICRALFPELTIAEYIGGVACILGHMFPMTLGFRGGKGLASLGGVALSWNWRYFFLLLATAILIALVTRYVCFVAPAMSVIVPGLFYWHTQFAAAALILAIPTLPIILKHVENFGRIRNGTEARFSYMWNKDAELKRLGRTDERRQNQK